ncbi:hypothetical protein RchiOBHm_Chr2g0156421 [Rosa chinensis]|uniref:Uncharacterized protein n=1 Tax=Rosa chinensis TaxID=74649 RepID=A0A2P6S1G3_ROSCH|nr:hypothetical protein RchiOBHm_Chr2g0156421 [Rosa chinensis]
MCTGTEKRCSGCALACLRSRDASVAAGWNAGLQEGGSRGCCARLQAHGRSGCSEGSASSG